LIVSCARTIWHDECFGSILYLNISKNFMIAAQSFRFKTPFFISVKGIAKLTREKFLSKLF